jgi:leucyl/phenylalanyl-tRNA---protein transferase
MSNSPLYQPFPPVELANPDGLLAVGGDLSPERLLDAYRNGIFPWYSANEPILWWSPDPRMVLFPHKLKISKSMKQLLRQDRFKVTFNEDFETVVQNCAEIKRSGQDDTWITEEMQAAYIKLHHLNIARSVEVWDDGELVGGLYGLYLKEKSVFCGESMFAKASNASKFGFIKWVEYLRTLGVKLIDCQVYTAHLESLGAEEISRENFLSYLK